MGAASGLLATVLFVIAFIIFLSTDPAGTPSLPNIDNAQLAPDYLSLHVNPIRLEILFNILGLGLFLWFLGTLLPRLRAAEGDPARGSTVASLGAVVGSTLVIGGLALSAANMLSTSPAQASVVPAFYAASALLVAFGGAAFSLFFIGVGKVIMHDRALGKWLGVLAYVVGGLCLFAFLTPFFPKDIFNAATGALGLWAWFAGAVIWLFLCSGAMTLEEIRQARAARPATPAEPVSEGGAS